MRQPSKQERVLYSKCMRKVFPPSIHAKVSIPPLNDKARFVKTKQRQFYLRQFLREEEEDTLDDFSFT